MGKCKRKGRIVQANKQVNIVQMSCPGRKSHRRKTVVRRRSGTPRRCMFASGRIFQRCGEAARIYYEAADAPASAIVRIDNDTRCTMVVRIEQQRGRELGGTVEQGQQVSFAAPSLIRVKIECLGSSGICKGFYRIQLLNG